MNRSRAVAPVVGRILMSIIFLLTGFHARDGALLLFLYLIPVTLIMHAFWTASGDQAQMQQVNFLKNLTIMGGLLLAWAVAPESRTFRVRR